MSDESGPTPLTHFQSIEIPYKKYFLMPGESKTAASLYYIQSGMVRSYFQNSRCTVNFYKSGEYVLSNDGTGDNSLQLECICDCNLIEYPKSLEMGNLEDELLYAQHINTLLTNLNQRNQFKEDCFLRGLLRERTQRFINYYHEYFQHIPKVYIASYLGVSPVSLSRILAGQRVDQTEKAQKSSQSG